MELSAKAFSIVVDSAIDTAIIALDHRGHVLTWSAGAVHILGWTEAQMQGQSLERIFAPEDHPTQRVAEEMAEAMAHGRGGHEGWRMRSDGSRIWAFGEMTPVTDPAAAPVAFVKVLRDRTAWKVAEEALHEETRTLEILNRAGTALARETDLSQLVQAVTDAGVEITRAAFGAFFYNVTAEAGESYMLYTLSGAPREAFSQYPMPRNTAIFAPTFNGEGIVRSDDITKDPRYGHNTPHWGMPKGHLKVVSYLAVPVASRSGEVIGGLFFGHPDAGVFTERSERSMVVLAAEAAIAIDNTRLFQAAQDELEERRRAEAALQALNATLEEQVAERTQQLRLHEDALRQAQKMEAVGQLTGGIAHDFNNLLHGIMGSLDLLHKRVRQGRTTELERFISGAMTSANRAAALTHRLLAFSRRQPLDPKPVRANPLVASMEDLLRRTLGEGIALDLVLAGGLWMTRCDENQLESAILNLAINARDAMPHGGKLTIETCNAHLDTAYAAQLRDVSPGQYVCVCVSDTGVGMSAETITHAFEPFFTTKPIGQGTGLGLSMIYGFARQSDGYAKIYSELGHGTTVKLYLPRHHAAGSPDEPVTADIAEHQTEHGEVVLVIEDEPVVRGLIVEVLSELGYHALEAADGSEGLELLRTQRRIDLLITDIGLPGLNGRQVVDAARLERPDLRVLFMTGYAENAALSAGFLEPGMAMITKPFAMENLASRISQMLRREGT
ncbi:MAG: histidine kinase [Rhizobacter sp.]|nr:histidine kinase [Rhizobacter sp.]